LVRHGEKGGKPTHPVQPNETAVQIGMSAQDVARCVIDSLAQPFGMDMVVLSGNPEMQPAL